MPVPLATPQDGARAAMAVVDTAVRNVEVMGMSRSECSHVRPLTGSGAVGRSAGERDTPPQSKPAEKQAKTGGRDGEDRGTTRSAQAEVDKVMVVVNQSGTKVMSRSERAETRKRPDWWGPFMKGSCRRMLKLRPHTGLPRAAEGEWTKSVAVYLSLERPPH